MQGDQAQMQQQVGGAAAALFHLDSLVPHAALLTRARVHMQAVQGGGAGGGAGGAAAVCAAAQPAQQHHAAAELPLPYLLDADGRKQPLPGAKSLFLRGEHPLGSWRTHTLALACVCRTASPAALRDCMTRSCACCSALTLHCTCTTRRRHGRGVWPGGPQRRAGRAADSGGAARQAARRRAVPGRHQRLPLHQGRAQGSRLRPAAAARQRGRRVQRRWQLRGRDHARGSRGVAGGGRSGGGGSSSGRAGSSGSRGSWRWCQRAPPQQAAA